MIPQSHIERVCATTGMEPVQAYRHLKALREGGRIKQRYYSDQKFQEDNR